MTLHHALHGHPIRVAVLTYIAGVSIGYERMTLDALTALHETTLQLTLFFRETPRATIMGLDMAGLYRPLAGALVMAFEQGDAGVWMLGLRAALAHLVDVVVMWLGLDGGFREVLVREWMPGLWLKVVVENLFFSGKGWLDDMWEVMEGRLAVRRGRGLRALEVLPGGGGGGYGDCCGAEGASVSGERNGEAASDGGLAGQSGRAAAAAAMGESPTRRPRREAEYVGTDGWMSDGARFTLEQWEKALEERRLRDLFSTGISGGTMRPVVNSGNRVPSDVAEHPYHDDRHRGENGRRDPGYNTRAPRSNDERATDHSSPEKDIPGMGRFR